ncbi:MAG: nucleoside-diphosphate sugar epimerase [Mucilaginibacter sp.]|nr:nucleoside-diphosphate sugar epimerase [Mucilaginibacter sp.]
MAKKAIVAGASGLIGSALLNILLQNKEYDTVLILVRRRLPIENNKLKQLIINFEQIEDHSKLLTGDVVFSCLGSTRIKTPDLKEYRKIDHDYPLRLAKIAFENGIRQFHLVSSIGADSSSSNFYTKMKGETEDDIKRVGLPALYIYQPSLLTGERKEIRIVEKIISGLFKVIDPLLFGKLKKYRSIAATTVAQAMFKQSIEKKEGIFIYPSDKIKQIS